MKTITSGLQSHIEQEVTTLAVCWLIVLQDGTRRGFTDHDQNIVIADWLDPDDVLNQTYDASLSYSRSALETSSDMSVDNLDAEGIIDSSGITDEDIRAGLYDGATIYVFAVNYADLTHGPLKLRKGSFGELKLLDYCYATELRGLAQKLTTHVVEQYQADCRAILGDARCGIDVESLKQLATVGDVTDRRQFDAHGTTDADSSGSYFVPGRVVWVTGDNAGLTMDIKKQDGDGAGSPPTDVSFELFLPMPYDIQVGDTAYFYPGCDGKLATCLGRFNNVVNFRGEPYVPVADQVIQYPERLADQTSSGKK